MKERTKAFTGGFVDAEGCLDIERHYQTKPPHHDCFYPVIDVSNTNIEVMKFISSRFGGNWSFKGNTRVGTPLYRWRTQGIEHLSSVLDDIFPYLWVKKPEAFILREFLALGRRHNSAKRLELHKKIQLAHHTRSVETDMSEFEKLKPNLIHACHAGLLDGENTVTIGCYPNQQGNPNFKPTVIFTNTHRPVVEQFLRYGGNIHTIPAKGNRIERYNWYVCGKEAQEKFMLKMLPYLIVKREPAKILLEYLRVEGNNPIRRRELMDKIKKFQMKGPRPDSNKIQPDLTGDRERATARTLLA